MWITRPLRGAAVAIMESDMNPEGSSKANFVLVAILVLVIIAAAAAYYWYAKSGAPASPAAAPAGQAASAPAASSSPTAAATTTSGLGAQLLQSTQNPLSGKLPQTSVPVPNPIQNVYKNPFQ